MILSDQHPVALAKLEHASHDAIAGLLPTENARRFGAELLAVLRKD